VLNSCQVEELMDMGADLTAKDKKGISALHYACGQGRLEVVKFLWSKGVDLDLEDPGTCSPTLTDLHLPSRPLALCAATFPGRLICIRPCRLVSASLLTAPRPTQFMRHDGMLCSSVGVYQEA
jgi:hypothetical protein